MFFCDTRAIRGKRKSKRKNMQEVGFLNIFTVLNLLRVGNNREICKVGSKRARPLVKMLLFCIFLICIHSFSLAILELLILSEPN